MTTRAYVRGSNGRFAGSNSGGKVTYGKAGGFANASFRARVAASRANGRPPKPAGQKASAGRSLGAAAGALGRSRAARAVGRGALTAGAGLAVAKAGSQFTQGTTSSTGQLLGRKPGTYVALGVIGARSSLNNSRPKISAGSKMKK